MGVGGLNAPDIIIDKKSGQAKKFNLSLLNCQFIKIKLFIINKLLLINR